MTNRSACWGNQARLGGARHPQARCACQLYSQGMTHRIGAKGQVVIPQRLRDRQGLTPGTEGLFEECPDSVLVRAEPVAHTLRGQSSRQRHGPQVARGSGCRAEVSASLDSRAVLAWLDGEELAAEVVQRSLDHGRPVMSWANLVVVEYLVRTQHGP